MKRDDYLFIKELTQAFGPSGYENEITNLIISRIIKNVSSLRIDKMGNLIAEKGNGKKALFSAHMDEVGLMITGFQTDGTLRFQSVGGISPEHLASKRVKIGSRRICGIISAKPIHLTKKAKTKVAFADLCIEIGAETEEEARRFINIGDFAVFDTETEAITTNHRISAIKGKAIDNRIGCFLLCKLIENPNIKDCTFLFSVQEETGLRGAAAFANSHSFPISIAVDVTTPNDLPGFSGPDKVCSLDKGPVISFADGRTIYQNSLIQSVFEILEKNNIKAQTKGKIVGGNDASAFQKNGVGMPVISLSLPCRYIHSSVGLFYITDLIESEKALLCMGSHFLNGGAACAEQN